MRLLKLLLIALMAASAAMAQPPGKADWRDQRFAASPSRVVRDSQTSLEWWPAPDIDVTWHDASRWAQYAAQYNGGWRLPTVQELEALYEKGNGAHNLDPAFQISAYAVWANRQKGDRSAWYFCFDTGKASWAARHRSPMKRAMAVRAVKDLPKEKEPPKPQPWPSPQMP